MTETALLGELLTAAYELQRKGFALVPIPRSGYRGGTGKGPIINGWQRRRFSLDEIRRILKSYGDAAAAIGVVTGPLSNNLVVLDFDGDGWQQAFEHVLQAWPQLRNTPSVKTGSGRRHIWLRCPDLPEEFTRQEFYIGAGKVELRGNRCQVLVPPSLHPGGGRYEWLISLDDAPLAEVSFEKLRSWLGQQSNRRSYTAKEARVDGAGDEPPVRLGAEELALWYGQKAVDTADGNVKPTAECSSIDRSRTLFVIGLALAKAGATAKTIVEALANRDMALGYAKYTERRNGREEYERIAAKVLSPNCGGESAGPERDTHERTAAQSTTIVMQRFYPRPFTLRLLSEYKLLSVGRDKGDFYRYDPRQGLWLLDAEAFIEHYFRSDLSVLGDEQKRRYVIDEIIADARGLCWRPGGMPEPEIWLIPFANGVYDLRTQELRDFTQEDYFTWKLPWRYNPHAQSTFIAEKLENFEQFIRTHFFEFLAYCLWRSYPYQRFFVWHGRGSNGKGFLANVITYALGIENVSNVTLADIQSNRFAAASLHRKLANIAGEVSYSDLENTDLLKKLTGNDWLLCERKYREPFPFKNHAKLLFLTNQVPKTRDTTDAFYRRAFLVNFERRFVEDPKVLTQLELLARSDAGAQEFEWLLYRAVQTLHGLIERNFVFTGHKSVEEARAEYERLSNPLRQFIQENCERTFSSDDYIFKFEFLERFNEWLAQRGQNAYNDRRLGRDMAELGFETGQRGENRWWAWIGIRWRPQDHSQKSQNSHLLDNNFPGAPEKLFQRRCEKCDFCELAEHGRACSCGRPVLSGRDRCDECTHVEFQKRLEQDLVVVRKEYTCPECGRVVSDGGFLCDECEQRARAPGVTQ